MVGSDGGSLFVNCYVSDVFCRGRLQWHARVDVSAMFGLLGVYALVSRNKELTILAALCETENIFTFYIQSGETIAALIGCTGNLCQLSNCPFVSVDKEARFSLLVGSE